MPLVEAIESPAALFDGQNRLITTNTGFDELFSAADWPSDRPSTPIEILQAAIEAGVVPSPPRLGGEGSEDSWAYEVRFKDGKTYASLAVQLNDGTRLWVLEDKSEMARRDASAQHTQKMALLSEISGNIAHDFNNLLTIIQGNLELIEELGGTDEKVRKWASTGLNASARAADLTQRLLSLSGRRQLDAEPLEIAEVLEPIADPAGSFADSGPIRVDAAEVSRLVIADKIQLQAALGCLIRNAAEASEPGAPIDIHARPADASELPDSLSRGDGTEYLTLVVSDRGCGMSEELIERSVEPFFSTKDAQSGSGLGLSMAYGFASRSGGALIIKSKKGEGTDVSMYLPMTDETQLLEDESGAVPRARSGQSILVVEDEADLRSTTCEILEGLGYRITQAKNGEEARNILERGTEFDLVLSDIVMPGELDGEDLAELIKENYPELPVLLASGYRSSVNRAKDHGFKVLTKPYSRRQLAWEVANVCGGD